MKKSILIYCLAVLMIPVLTGCEKSLDVKPTQEIDESDALRTSSDVEAALIGAYSDLGDVDVYGGSLQVAAELLTAANEINWSGSFETYSDFYAKSTKTVNTQVSFFWMDCYRVINDVNNVLAALEVVNAERRDRVEGEAKFLRACMHFELVRFFARPWQQGNPAENPGVPIMLKPYKSDLPDNELRPARAKVAAVYDQVIKDLIDAENLLEVPSAGYFFAHKIAAQAMLARVYLQKGDFPNAAAAANRALEDNQSGGEPFRLLPSYFDVFPYNGDQPSLVIGNTPEDVFAIQVSNTDGTNDFFTYFSADGRGDIDILQDHLDQYEPNDERLNLFYGSSAVYTGKFDMQYSNVHIIRLAELYLTRAEANFRSGNQVGPNTPREDINIIRNRVGLDSYDDDADITLARILHERRLELAFEGFLLHDIKRNQQTIGGYAWNDPKLVLPIPDREIRANTNLLPQNDGYGN
jgi:tetratricopeptide (TPR) repeat protein